VWQKKLSDFWNVGKDMVSTGLKGGGDMCMVVAEVMMDKNPN